VTVSAADEQQQTVPSDEGTDDAADSE